MGEEQYKWLKSSSFIRSQQVLKLTKNKKNQRYIHILEQFKDKLGKNVKWKQFKFLEECQELKKDVLGWEIVSFSRLYKNKYKCICMCYFQSNKNE